MGIQAGIFHGGKSLCQPRRSLDYAIDEKCECRINTELVFDIEVCNIPRNAKLCFVVYEVNKYAKGTKTKKTKDITKVRYLYGSRFQKQLFKKLNLFRTRTLQFINSKLLYKNTKNGNDIKQCRKLKLKVGNGNGKLLACSNVASYGIPVHNIYTRWTNNTFHCNFFDIILKLENVNTLI